MKPADRIEVERLGGFAGFGSPGSRLRSRGGVKVARLSGADCAAVDRLFASPPARAANAAAGADGFRYRLTRGTGEHAETIEVDEQHVPEAMRNCVKDGLA